ncbi:unnamed protein product, partial [Aureobasidium pullulans]
MSLTPSELNILLGEPALVPPAGFTPDYDDPPNRNGLAWFVTTFCMLFATTLVVVRLYAKFRILKAVHTEEFLMLCAYGGYWCTAYAGYRMIYTPGYYVHQWNLRNAELVEPLYLILVYGCAYSATLALVKTAILIDWCRMFVVGNCRGSYFWWISMIIILVQVTWGIACIVLLNMQCIPHAAIWKFYIPSRCYSLSTVMLISASVQVLSDWSMILLPQKIIWGLQMNWRKKVGVSITFGVGLLACIAATVRLSTTITFSHEDDRMYYIAPLLFWACAEMTCGFFILGLPCVPALIKGSGLRDTIENFLGLSLSSSNERSRTHRDRPTQTSSHLPITAMESKPMRRDLCSQLYNEEDGLQLYTLEGSESQERLRVEKFE